MNKTWDWKTDIVINSEPKNESNPRTGTFPPSLVRGHMFHGPANSSDVFIYGGTTYMGNQSFQGYSRPDASTYPLWSYTYDSPDYPWMQYDISQPWRPNHGAAAEAIDQGLGFYLNGQIDAGTSTKTLRLNDTNVYTPLDGMLVINLVDHTSQNISTPNLTGDRPRVSGSMEYIAPVGGMGILVAIGGQIADKSPLASSSGGQLLDFSTVDVFDIDSYVQNPSSNGTWYPQKTTGEIPDPRIDFCLVSISTTDNSSHHIYLYGGINPTQNNTMYDDVYVLSLPSFAWTNIFRDGESPRWGHNCHVAGNRQMLTVGGNITNLQCDWEAKGVAFLDMSDITWGSVFLTNTSTYQVPQKVLPAVGGTRDGGATVKEPKEGWTNAELKKVFDTPRRQPGSTPAPSSTNEPEKKSMNAGAIAGGVVGGVIVLAVLAGGSFVLWRRRRAKANAPSELPDDQVSKPPEELGDEKKTFELQGVNQEPVELPGADPAELGAAREIVEAPRETATKAAELPGTNTVPGGKHGVPIVRTPDDELPSPPISSIDSPPPATSPPPDAQKT
ncbi:hypothetical protein K469DRAFT_728851 [Zopfia rhizophila CBS 207.26]|uniref:Cell wall anchored protein n=1 Tax=Zopfia rhizophila CBS 207.26 TaxID=1314779 RepID=A0A6A6ENM2_9PEZI|nr:hypothetical protein K469DRAFT_728851 [Zopfia rhizophila CBS 207.26]